MRHRKSAELAVAACVFLLPFLPKVLFRLPWLMLQNFTDGVFYLGYALHFRELVDRVGLNYYAVRFGGIWPDALAFSLLGPEVGLVLVRYALAGACCLSLYFVFWRRYSRAVGLLAALAWALNPAAIRFLQTAYVDVSAASFLCIGTALACMPGVGGVRCFLAGALMASSFWAHLHAAVALAFMAPLVLAVFLERGWSRALALSCWLGAGFLATTAAGVAFYFLHFGLWDLTSPTRELLRTLRDGHIPAPKLTWPDVLRQCPFWLAVVPLAFGGLCLGRRDRILYGAMFAFVGYVAFLLWGDVVGGGYSLSLFYYFSFALPAFVFLVGALIGNASAASGGWKPWIAFSAALCAPVLAVGWSPANNIWSLSLLALLAAAPTLFLDGPKPRSFLISLAISVAVVLTAMAPTSRLALGNYWKGDDLPVLSAAKELAAILPSHQQKPAPLVFWYDDKDGSDLRMLQSFHLHEFSKWKDASGCYVPFPAAGRPAHQAVWHGGAGDLVVLATSESELESALDTLRSQARSPESVQKFQIPASAPIAYGARVAFAEPHAREVASLLDRLEYHRRTKVSETNRLEFLTVPRKWNQAVTIPIPPLSGGQALRVVLEVSQGALIVDVEEAGKNGEGRFPHFVSASQKPASLIIEPSASANPVRLRIRNAAPHGVRSKARIDGISVVEIIR